jgi:hypothetical protein
LSLLSSASIALNPEDAYAQAGAWLLQMDDDGFFASDPTPQRSERSARPASSSRPSNSGSRGRDNSRQPFTGQMQNPDGPPSDKQVDFLLTLTDDYGRGEVKAMTKQQVSDLIQDLKDF